MNIQIWQSYLVYTNKNRTVVCIPYQASIFQSIRITRFYLFLSMSNSRHSKKISFKHFIPNGIVTQKFTSSVLSSIHPHHGAHLSVSRIYIWFLYNVQARLSKNTNWISKTNFVYGIAVTTVQNNTWFGLRLWLKDIPRTSLNELITSSNYAFLRFCRFKKKINYNFTAQVVWQVR